MDPRLEWLVAVANDEDEARRAGPPDAVTGAALAIADKYGWWYDPVLSPEMVLEIAELVEQVLRSDDLPPAAPTDRIVGGGENLDAPVPTKTLAWGVIAELLPERTYRVIADGAETHLLATGGEDLDLGVNDRVQIEIEHTWTADPEDPTKGLGRITSVTITQVKR